MKKRATTFLLSRFIGKKEIPAYCVKSTGKVSIELRKKIILSRFHQHSKSSLTTKFIAPPPPKKKY